MTEDEAKGKWCCGPLHGDLPSAGVCIGSACMAWRWLSNTSMHYPHDEGFCGLTGKL